MFKFIVASEKPLIIPVFVPHLGCPNICMFCNQKIISGVEIPTLGDIEKNVKEYLSFSKKREKTEISFYGGSFTAIPFETMMSYIAKGAEFIESGLIDSLRCSTRPDTISEKIADTLKKNHFETVELGVQTMSGRLLEKMKRGHTVEDVFKATQILKKYKLKTVLQFMTGYPDETKDDIAATLNSLKELSPDFLRIYPFVPLEGSGIFKEIENHGKTLVPANEVIERTVSVFIEAMKQNIPVIRIGLPIVENSVSPYPHNLLQVVVSRAIERLAENGVQLFDIPKEWLSCFRVASKKYKTISLA
ncbi:MAG: radical SAM protein [bacterium]